MVEPVMRPFVLRRDFQSLLPPEKLGSSQNNLHCLGFVGRLSKTGVVGEDWSSLHSRKVVVM